MEQDIQIEQDAEWCIVEGCPSPYVIDAGAMGPCVSIFIHDAKTKVTYCCHYTSPDEHQSVDVIDMVDSAILEFSASNEIKVFVTGAVLKEKNSIKKRAYIENMLTSKFNGKAELNFLWPEKDIDSVELIFEPSTGLLLEPKT